MATNKAGGWLNDWEDTREDEAPVLEPKPAPPAPSVPEPDAQVPLLASPSKCPHASDKRVNYYRDAEHARRGIVVFSRCTVCGADFAPPVRP